MKDDDPTHLVENGADHSVTIFEVTGNAKTAKSDVTTDVPQQISPDKSFEEIRDTSALTQRDKADSLHDHGKSLDGADATEAHSQPTGQTPLSQPVITPDAVLAQFHSRLAALKHTVNTLNHRLNDFEEKISKEADNQPTL